ncbi:MAG: spore germination protein [Clostridiales bacterium]|nr:spore germination protein [Clostridiales bacterium]
MTELTLDVEKALQEADSLAENAARDPLRMERPWRHIQLSALVARIRVETVLADFLQETPLPFPADLEKALALVQAFLSFSSDVVFRRFHFQNGVPGAIAFINGMVDQRVVDQDLLVLLRDQDAPQDHTLVSPIGQLSLEPHPPSLLLALLQGEVVVFCHGFSGGWHVDAKGFPKRAIEIAETEQNQIGPKASFVEDITSNLTLIRRHISSPSLRVKEMTLGRRSKTLSFLVYLADVADPRLVAAIEARLAAIDTDVILAARQVTSFLRDRPWSPFPILALSERPDWCAWQISSGRVVILVNGDPFAIIAPSVFWDFFRTADDYTVDVWTATFIRFIRYMGAFIGLFAPGLYVALINVHPELIPVDLALAIVSSREGLPFPAYFEMALMLLAFELIREVSVRMPKVMGQTLGVVGGLVIGQASVQAGIISPLMVVVIAVTSLSVFVLPKFEMTSVWRILLWIGLALSSFLGLYGLTLFAIGLLFHLSALTSIGVPYLAPVAPWSHEALGDILFRAPHRAFRYRPGIASPQDVRRAKRYRQPFPRLSIPIEADPPTAKDPKKAEGSS